MNKWIIAIFTGSLIAGIFFFNKKSSEQDLGDNYFYLPEYEAIDIGYPEGAIIYRSNKRNVFKNIKIHGSVVDVNSDEDFIIALQQQKDSANKEKDGLLRYFIIVKQTDSVYGPLEKAEYMQIRRELNISKDLQFKGK